MNYVIICVYSQKNARKRAIENWVAMEANKHYSIEYFPYVENVDDADIKQHLPFRVYIRLILLDIR